MSKGIVVIDELYKAGQESIVAEATSNSTFEKIAKVGTRYIGTVEQFYKELQYAETAIKKDFELKKMPNPWRSAKSVITTCLHMGIPLHDDNGDIFGKTALQTAIKAKRSAKSETLASYSSKLIGMIARPPSGIDSMSVQEEIKRAFSLFN